MKEQSLDIRAEAFAPLLDSIQEKITALMHELCAGKFQGGRVSMAMDVELVQMSDLVTTLDVEGNFGQKWESHQRPVVEYQTKLTLKKERAEKAELDLERQEVIWENDIFLLREQPKEQISFEDLTEGATADLDLGETAPDEVPGETIIFYADGEAKEVFYGSECLRTQLGKMTKTELVAEAAWRGVEIDEFAPIPQIIDQIIAALGAREDE